MGLDRPYWAMATAYIVAQPLTGAMRSKAAYRFYGTLLGAVACLVLIPNLVDAPVLLIAALSLWVGGCIYFAVLDRTPRSYVFLLAGYSVALIGFPIVDAPGTVWDVVLARVEEITLGIVCTTVIGSIVFPIPLGPALTARLDNWIEDAAEWTLGVLSGAPEGATTAAARRKVAGDAGEIAMLATHLAYDTSNLQTATVPVAILHQRILLLLPVVSGAADRIRILREIDGITSPLRSILDRMSAWIQSGRGADLSEAAAVHVEIDALEPKIDASADWKTVVLVGLLVRLRELTDLVHDIMALRRQIRAEDPRLAKLTFAQGETIHTLQHRDHVMALHSALATILAIGLISAFWIASAWPEGGGAASLAAIACAFFAAQDDPVPNIVGFLVAAVIALVIDAIYLFAILPRAHDFEMLVLAFAPVFLLLGALASMPATARAGGPISLHRRHPTRAFQQLQRRLPDVRQRFGRRHRRPRRHRDHHPHLPLCQRRMDSMATAAAQPRRSRKYRRQQKFGHPRRVRRAHAGPAQPCRPASRPRRRGTPRPPLPTFALASTSLDYSTPRRTCRNNFAARSATMLDAIATHYRQAQLGPGRCRTAQDHRPSHRHRGSGPRHDEQRSVAATRRDQAWAVSQRPALCPYEVEET